MGDKEKIHVFTLPSLPFLARFGSVEMSCKARVSRPACAAN
jgi:hypothetical protein